MAGGVTQLFVYAVRAYLTRPESTFAAKPRTRSRSRTGFVSLEIIQRRVLQNVGSSSRENEESRVL